jgi:enterobacterial common antigen flippase
VVVLGFTAIRSKVIAMSLGAQGVGVFGLYNALSLLVAGVCSFGVGTSGVRLIAEAVASNQSSNVTAVVATLRKFSFFLSVAAAILVLGAASPIAAATFGDNGHSANIAIIAAAVAFTVLCTAEVAIVQGMRKVRQLAIISIVGAVIGTVGSIPAVLKYGERGVVLSVVFVAGASWLCTAAYSHRIAPMARPLPSAAGWMRMRQLLWVGGAVTVSSLVANAVNYITRLSITNGLGLDAAGYFQAASTLSGVYVGFVLAAMGADYFPRLAGAGNVKELNRLLNEQSEAALLIALPGVVGTLTLAPFVMEVFYSDVFSPSVQVLRWQVLGVLGRVASWPLSFILLARGSATAFLLTELVTHALHVVLIILGMHWLGLEGLGVAFFVLYLFYTALMIVVVKRLTGCGLNSRNLAQIVSSGGVAIVTFCLTSELLPLWARYGSGFVITIGMVFRSVTEILKRTRGGYS